MACRPARRWARTSCSTSTCSTVSPRSRASFRAPRCWKSAPVPAVSLLYLSYNGRFLALAQLVRTLQREHREHHDPVALAQISSLRRRLGLIVWMQVAGALSFVAAAVSATAVFYGAPTLGQLAFGGALLLLIVSVLILLAEVIISTRALSLLLAQSEEGTRGTTVR